MGKRTALSVMLQLVVIQEFESTPQSDQTTSAWSLCLKTQSLTMTCVEYEPTFGCGLAGQVVSLQSSTPKGQPLQPGPTMRIAVPCE